MFAQRKAPEKLVFCFLYGLVTPTTCSIPSLNLVLGWAQHSGRLINMQVLSRPRSLPNPSTKNFEVEGHVHFLVETSMCWFLEFVVSYSSKLPNRMVCWTVDL